MTLFTTVLISTFLIGTMFLVLIAVSYRTEQEKNLRKKKNVKKITNVEKEKIRSLKNIQDKEIYNLKIEIKKIKEENSKIKVLLGRMNKKIDNTSSLKLKQ